MTLLPAFVVDYKKTTCSAIAGEERTQEIGVEAYIYAYPLMLMEITRRVSTNAEAPKGVLAPLNQFAQLRAFPDHIFREVIRSNADTLYSICEPMLSHHKVII